MAGDCVLVVQKKETFFWLLRTLADDERNVRRATVPYAPLYPTFQESLNRFRQGEHSELIQRGADRVVHNVGIYDTRRSSEDEGVNLVVVHPADIPSAGPQESTLDNGVRPDPPVWHIGPPNPPAVNTDDAGDCVSCCICRVKTSDKSKSGIARNDEETERERRSLYRNRLDRF